VVAPWETRGCPCWWGGNGKGAEALPWLQFRHCASTLAVWPAGEGVPAIGWYQGRGLAPLPVLMCRRSRDFSHLSL